LIDYENQRRVKIWGTARVEEGNQEEIAKYMPKDYKAKPERVIYFTLAAWDPNCPQHIPARIEALF
jgi:predicted pyridoxine 5'-phosphate oxidase superfamily flavin-nucleotide-binding protein